MMSIRGISKSFGGIRAVNNASFEIDKGTITALIGPNGAGKTTLFNIVAGFLRPDAGQVILNGQDVTGLPPHRLFARGLMRTFQIPAAFERMTLLDNLMVVPAGQSGENVLRSWFLWGRVTSEEVHVRQKAKEVLDFLGLTHVAGEYAGNLSGGQKKLLELGRTMMSDPDIVLLDEPGAGVNPTLMVKLADDIRRLNEERGYTFCIIDHDMDLVAKLCHPIVVMAEGAVLAQGSMEDIRKNQEVLDAYLGGGRSARIPAESAT
ncbi:MAG: ABC transporter ATP-binding protein [Proteobacteria bacterium]|nr:ABC transporter ATP-binding protein [Pseudomonadota bacterium]MDA1059303.1 ABC transporter ATP-binding protein [Pseudomonadota bacterium]